MLVAISRSPRLNPDSSFQSPNMFPCRGSDNMAYTERASPGCAPSIVLNCISMRSVASGIAIALFDECAISLRPGDRRSDVGWWPFRPPPLGGFTRGAVFARASRSSRASRDARRRRELVPELLGPSDCRTFKAVVNYCGWRLGQYEATTIVDVAELAGLSKSLVSLIMRGSDQVSGKSRSALPAAVRELRYNPCSRDEGTCAHGPGNLIRMALAAEGPRCAARRKSRQDSPVRPPRLRPE